MREQKAEVRDRLDREKKLTDAIDADLKAAIDRVQDSSTVRSTPKTAPVLAKSGA